MFNTSVLRYHQELRIELSKEWIKSLRTKLEPAVRCLLGDDWKEVAEKYLHKLEEEAREMYHNTTQRKRSRR